MAGKGWTFSAEHNDYYMVTRNASGQNEYLFWQQYLANQQQSSPPAETPRTPNPAQVNAPTTVQAGYSYSHSTPQQTNQPQANAQEAQTTAQSGHNYSYSPPQQANQPQANAQKAPTTGQAGSGYSHPRRQQTNQPQVNTQEAPTTGQAGSGYSYPRRQRTNQPQVNAQEAQRTQYGSPGGDSGYPLNSIPASRIEEGITNPRNLNAGGTTRAANDRPTTGQNRRPRRQQGSIVNSHATESDMNPNFIVYPSDYFVLGKVFRAYWTEPASQNAPSGNYGGGSVTSVGYGENAYSNFRRFAIISVGERHALCVPITTYGSQGTLKEGVNVARHAIIYIGDFPGPAPLPGEYGIVKESIMVDPDTAVDRLDPISRINFGKVYTVEFYHRIFPVGKVAPSSMPYFRAYAQEVIS